MFSVPPNLKSNCKRKRSPRHPPRCRGHARLRLISRAVDRLRAVLLSQAQLGLHEAEEDRLLLRTVGRVARRELLAARGSPSALRPRLLQRFVRLDDQPWADLPFSSRTIEVSEECDLHGRAGDVFPSAFCCQDFAGLPPVGEHCRPR